MYLILLLLLLPSIAFSQTPFSFSPERSLSPFGSPNPDSPPYTYTFPSSNTSAKLSIIAGTAFVDLSTLSVASSANGTSTITITDSTGKTLTGFLKTPGTGETYGATLFLNGTFAADASWTKGTGWTIAAGKGSHAAGTSSSISQNVATSGQLILLTIDVLDWVAGSLTAFGLGSKPIPGTNNNGTNLTVYGTPSAAGLGYTTLNAATNLSIDNALGQQVLTPSILGARVVSTSGGAVFNWTSETGGFNRNDPSGYRVVINRLR